jgi:hypothetical protein
VEEEEMKLQGLFFGIAFLMLAYLVQIPSFDVTIIPGWFSAPIPNPFYVFHQFSILLVVIGIICFAGAIENDEKLTMQKRKTTN